MAECQLYRHRLFDLSYFVDIDLAGDVYVFGVTNGNYPISPGVYNNPLGGQFIHKLTPSLSQSLFSTRIGSSRGTPDISPTAFMVSDCGNIYLAGWGGHTNTLQGFPAVSTTGLPVTADALRRTTDGDDFYLAMLSRNAQSLLYGTFFGGTDKSGGAEGDHVDGGTSRFDKNGMIYHSVCACRTNAFPVTPGAWSTVNNAASVSNCNNAAFKISLDVLKADFDIVDDNGNIVTAGCAPMRVTLRNKSTNAVAYRWEVDGQVISTSFNHVMMLTNPGAIVVRLTAFNDPLCLVPGTLTKLVQVFPGTFDAGPDQSICYGDKAQLTASGGTIYSWTPTTGLSNPFVANPVASPLQTTVYRVKISADGRCTGEDSVVVNVAPQLTADFNLALSDSCMTYPTINIINRSKGAATYLWDFGNGTTSTLPQPAPFKYSQEGTYTVTLTVRNGSTCTKTTFKNVTVKFNPSGIASLNISPGQKICAGDTVQLAVSGGTKYVWSPATGLSSTTTANPRAFPSVTTRYSVKIFGNANCSVDTVVVVEVLPRIAVDFDIQLLDSCSLFPTVKINNRSTGGTTYTWDFGDGRPGSNVFQPAPFQYTGEGTYQVTLVAGNAGCSKFLTRQVVFKRNMDSDFKGRIRVPATQKICRGDTVQLPVTGGTRYRWTPATGLSSTSSANPSAFPAVTTRYTVRIFNALDCYVDSTVLVEVAPRLSADFDVQLEELCEPYPLVRIISKAEGGDSYFWDFGNGTSYMGVQPPPFKYTSDGTFKITLIARNSNCTRTKSVATDMKYELSADFYKSIRMPSNKTVCQNDGVQLNIITSRGVRFQWTPTTGLNNATINNPVATPSVTTRYSVRIFNQRGCYVDSSVVVEVVPEIKPDFEVVVSSECGKQGTVKFVNKSTGTDKFKWVMGNKKDTLYTSTPPEQSFDESGTYEIILEAFNGICSRQKSIKVPVENIMPPNVITPNGDSHNERFAITNVRPGWKLEVYDRWGKQVFKSDDYKNDWGSDATSSVYYYRLTSPEGKSCKGWIQVLK